MTSLRGAFALFTLFLAGLPAVAAEPLGSSEEGVVVLRSGQVLAGQVERLGNHYVVYIGSGAKVHLPAADVDLCCRSLEEAYLRKRGYVDPDNAREHVHLADWCLRQGLTRRAAEELTAAALADPDEPRIAQVERRLRDSLAGPAAAKSTAKTGGAAPKLDDLEEVMRSVPAGALERFTSSVQPVLLNRCSTSSCHGTASKSSFKLLRPAAGDTITRRYTQRNLQAVLQTVDRAAPEASPLLTAPRGAHGSARTPVFGHRDERQYEQLVQWVKQVTEPAPARQAASLALAEPHLMQATEGHAPRTSFKPSAWPHSPGAKAKSSDSPESSDVRHNAAPPAGKPVPADPHDPEIFNRRFLDKRVE